MALLKRSKKIAKISVLIAIRQFWGLLCNLYLLTYQPFLTLRTIRATHDKSQFLLIGAVTLSPFFAYLSARLILDIRWYGEWRLSVGAVFGLTLLIEIILLGYLGYWTGIVLKKNHKDQFLKELKWK